MTYKWLMHRSFEVSKDALLWLSVLVYSLAGQGPCRNYAQHQAMTINILEKTMHASATAAATCSERAGCQTAAQARHPHTAPFTGIIEKHRIQRFHF